jgi:DNA end-binding protein Ku
MTTKPNPPRCVRAATLHFGLVAVPLKLYTSTESADDISFHMHHDADKGRLKQQYICLTCKEVVDGEHTVKGYEFAKDQHVILSKDELDALDSVATNEIKVEEFVTASAVDPTYIEKTYYLGPGDFGEKAFVLLAEAMAEMKRVAIGTYARAGKERVVMIRPIGERLALHELRYASEVKALDSIPAPDVTSTPALLKLAKQMIGQMSASEFVPERYVDTVQQRQRKLIEAKIAGGAITVAPSSPAQAAAASGELVDALRASLDVVKTKAAKRVDVKRSRPARAARVARKRRVS